MLMAMALYDEKSHIAAHFDHLDLTKGMVSVMTLLASGDTDTSFNGIT